MLTERDRVKIMKAMRIPDVQIFLEKKAHVQKDFAKIIKIQSLVRGYLQRRRY